MKDLVKIEFIKLIKHNDFFLMISMLFIPVMYSVGLAMNVKSFTYIGEQKVSGLAFASEMYTFVYMCFIYFIILSVCVIRSLKGEIENKIIQLYTQRINNRKKIYLAKNAAYLILAVSAALIFIITSIICFYLFMIRRADIAVPQFCENGELLYYSVNILAILLCFIFTVNLSLFLGAYKKSFQAMGIFVFVWLAFMYLKEISYVKYFVPIYYVEEIVNSDMGNCEWKYLVILLMLVFIYSVISIVLGQKKFEKSDI